MQEDWRKSLDSRLSLTQTDSRRRRMTRELIRKSFMDGNELLAQEADGKEEAIREERRKALRAKGSLTMEEVLELGEFPGALYDRNTDALSKVYGELLPIEPTEMIRLHVELVMELSESEKEELRRHGALEGETISRDLLVSDDLPLYALHYAIQRAFGFTNSHLHRFFLSQEQQEKLTKSAEQWRNQVGVIYRSPLMSEQAPFWADDYTGGSIKKWLREKYTGPCVSQCREEGLISCREDMERVDLEEEYYVVYGSYKEGKAAEPLGCVPVLGASGRKNRPPTAEGFPYQNVHQFHVQVMKLRDLPVSLIGGLFERDAFDLLERLPIGEVLALHNMSCEDDFREWDRPFTYEEMLENGLRDDIQEILEEELDLPELQPALSGFTEELFYQYDFGDNWEFRITGSRNCADLVESGKMTQDALDKSNIKARVTYGPVLLARSGEMLIEDVGGVGGFAEFIRDIHTMRRGERDKNGMTKTDMKAWARYQGWHRDMSPDYTLL